MRSQEDQLRDWSKRADAALMNNGAAVSEFVRPYHVAIISANSDKAGRPRWTGSGVLVDLGPRSFILTAGHVVKDAGGDPVGLALTEHPRDIKFALPARNYVLSDQRGDFGYFEVPAHDRNTIRSQTKLFAGPERLFVEEAANLEGDDHYVVAGFPGASADDGGPHGLMMRFHLVATSLAGFRGTAASSTPTPTGLQALDLVYNSEAALVSDLMTDDHAAVTLVELQGSSGGGCWKGFVVPEPAGWDPSKLRLVGIHCGRTRAKDTCARQVLIGHHLRLIAHDYADMATDTFARWPLLTTWST